MQHAAIYTWLNYTSTKSVESLNKTLSIQCVESTVKFTGDLYEHMRWCSLCVTCACAPVHALATII